MIKSGSQILADALIGEGVEYIFGMPGGATLPLFDVLYDSPIKFLLTRHEQGAGHAADGYARATGKVGVCLATSGPGATNLITAIATAYMDSVPIVAITGQVKTFLIGNDAFQEVDIIGISRPVTKHSYLVKDVKDIARIVKEAFYLASSGRQGPVLIDLPVDVSMAKFEDVATTPSELNLPGYKPTKEGNIRQIKFAAEVINNSQRPVLYTGGGIVASDSAKELLELSEKGNIPVATTLMGLGGFPETHDLSLGMLGMHGTAYANFAVTECDVLIAVGSRFDDRVTGKIDEFAPRAKIVHIDIDPASISKNIKVHVPIVGNAKLILSELNKHIHFVERKEWIGKIKEWKRKNPLTYDKNANVIKPQYVIEQISDIINGEAIITTEVGQHQMWAAQFFTYTKPRTFLSSGGLGTMGYGLPAALGAQLGCPDKIVVDIAGDGSVQMNIQELSTAVRLKIPIKVVILNNGFLGMVRQWQELFYDKRYSGVHLDGNPDFVKLAESYGAKGFLVEKKEDVRPVLEQAFSLKEPVVIDFRIDPDENVFPMVPAGQAINRMIGTMA